MAVPDGKSPGDVFHVWIESVHLGGQPAKFKYLISVDDKDRRFLAINSSPRTLTPADNVPLSKGEAAFLAASVSYIDTSRVIGLMSSEWSDGMSKAGAGFKGKLSAATKARIKKPCRLPRCCRNGRKT